MGKPHYVVIQNVDGSIGKFRMKPWLRDNPRQLPDGFDQEGKTAHQLRGALKKQSWRLEILPSEVLIIKPGANGDTSYADEIELSSSGYDEEQLEIEEDAEEVTFALERDLQEALRRNITQLEAGLKIADGGKERNVEAGRIDITAEDSAGRSVVIELKAGIASPDVVAQVLAYMGSIAETDRRPVRGIIVAGDFHKKVILAARALPNLELKKYSFQFTFHKP